MRCTLYKKDDRRRGLRIYVACIDKITILESKNHQSGRRSPAEGEMSVWCVRPPANNTPFTLTESHTPESKVVAPCEK